MKAFRKKIQNLKHRKYYSFGKIFLMAVLVILFLDKCTWMPMPPWKETDPAKPGFKIENFEYEDYLFYSPHNRMVYTLGYPFKKPG